jgi:hypothetical protein
VVKGGYDDEETETETEVKVASKKLAVGTDTASPGLRGKGAKSLNGLAAHNLNLDQTEGKLR